MDTYIEKKVIKILKEIKKGYNRIYFFAYCKITYFFISLNFEKNLPFKISLLCPTKNRSKKFERFLKSLINNTNNINNVELLLLFDDYEEEQDYYIKLLVSSKIKINFKYFNMQLTSHAKRNNFLAKYAIGDIILPINDDIVFKTYKWDFYLIKEFSKIDMSKPFCIWLSCDRKYKYLDYSAFPAINRKWYQSLGYIAYEKFKFWYLDWWICDISRIAKKYLVTNKVVIKQFHANTYKNEIDQTHLINSNTENLNYDKNVWLNTHQIRVEEAIKLI